MGQSFYRGKDADLFTGSQTFSDLINATPTAYGLTTLQASQYATFNSTFAAAYLLSKAPETRTKGTIKAKDDARDALRFKAAALAKIVEATPTVTNQQRVDLGLSVRATPGPRPAPGTPSGFRVELMGDGSVKSTWKANNPSGTTGVIYQIYRRLGSEGNFDYIGATGEKKFVDSTIPAGTTQVQYQMQGVRTTGAGGWAQFNVNFGMAAGGGGAATSASVTETKPTPKLAA